MQKLLTYGQLLHKHGAGSAWPVPEKGRVSGTMQGPRATASGWKQEESRWLLGYHWERVGARSGQVL